MTAQTEQVLTNLAAVLEAAGSSLNDVLKATIFLEDMADFSAVNAVYAQAFSEHRPARECVAARALLRGAAVEISCIARVSEPCCKVRTAESSRRRTAAP